MGIAFCKNSFIGELFWHFRIYGYTFEKFLRIYKWYFYDLNDTTPYLGKSSDLPGKIPIRGKLTILDVAESIKIVSRRKTFRATV